MTAPMPTIGRIVLYRTDGRNGLVYDLPAIVTCTADSHPGDYPDGRANPLPVPDPGCVHLTVFTPGGFGTTVKGPGGGAGGFVGAESLAPGSGTYVELNVPAMPDDAHEAPHRSWRWPDRVLLGT